MACLWRRHRHEPDLRRYYSCMTVHNAVHGNLLFEAFKRLISGYIRTCLGNITKKRSTYHSPCILVSHISKYWISHWETIYELQLLRPGRIAKPAVLSSTGKGRQCAELKTFANALVCRVIAAWWEMSRNQVKPRKIADFSYSEG